MWLFVRFWMDIQLYDSFKILKKKKTEYKNIRYIRLCTADNNMFKKIIYLNSFSDFFIKAIV